MAKPIEVTLRPKGQALGFGVRHRDDEWDDDKSTKAAAKVGFEMCGGKGLEAFPRTLPKSTSRHPLSPPPLLSLITGLL